MTGVCPDCGTPLPKDAALLGLCPQCLLSMALEGEENPTLQGPGPGGILGERYQIREVLGRGGMGEVYRAFDLKLRVDVALKAVRPELSSSEKARELLRQEVRSAREVLSPNVCRIFDLVVEEGRELVSMEYIDGTTLAETLRERGPLELQEAREIAAQFLSGLEAIHEAGLVHRDFKPENVMLTRAGRVVVMDFGLAKARNEGKSRTIVGTPAYMSPEQSRGEPVDARSDVFSAGVVLAEMLWAGTRQEVWQKVREVPPQVPEGPWAPVLRPALASERENRHPTARALARALDEVTHRLPGFEDKHPYPGLASFTQEDAEYFFGREMEVEAVWKKMKRPRLLALIGPSGAGKSSFLRAGLLPTLPAGWRVILSTPGHHPLQALAEVLLPAFAGDMQAIQSFLRFNDPETALTLFSAWRNKGEHALVIVDQFEELFTLNPPEVQEAFATLLGRLVLEADVHVLVSLRDDFLFYCQKHEALSPVFSELTPLGTLSESALRRALVQPALACGYRFEDEALVEEMVSEVSHERGVLPLLAFAASRLWEKRDREKGLLTREAYQEIGGVGGALAQHAEETLDRIGAERTLRVRELFRNLVTAQGTRASREVEELLSIFPKEDERKAAEEVLRELVSARLLTAYETSVEIIHESLLNAWPRLVQWRNQDEGGALLRDQLRQAAQAWQDRGRPDDLLWTGRSHRELSLWRESYPGGLSTTEEAFAQAAAKFAGRRRRRRRIAVAASFTLLLGVMGVFISLWRQSVLEVSRREAAQILTLGRLALEDRPTAALAHALASLERADNEAALTFRYGYFSFDDDYRVPEFNPAELGFSQRFLDQITANVFPFLNIDGYDFFGNWATDDDRLYSHSANGTVSQIVGNHSLKFGGDYRRIGEDALLGGPRAGEFSFDAGFTQGPDPFNPEASGSSLASLLLGYPSFGWTFGYTRLEQFIDYFAGFIQDDWRISPNLVLNLGIRLEHETGPREKENRQTVGFDRDTPWPLQPIEGMTLRGGLMYAGVDGNPEHQGDPQALKWGPRAGFAWSLDESTVLRGGYGVFWAPYQSTYETRPGYDAPTYYLPSTDGGLTPAGTLSDPFPFGLEQPVGSSLGLLTGAGGDVEFADQFRKSAYVQQYSAELQREIPGGVVVSGGYLGSRSDRLGLAGVGFAAVVNINQVDPRYQSLGSGLLDPVPNPFFGNPLFGDLSQSETVTRAQLLRPYPQFGALYALQPSEGRRRYDAAVFRFEKRFRGGYGGRVNYTWSRTDDNVIGEGNAYSNRNGSALDNYNLDAEYSRSITDAPHRLNVSGIVELPFGKGKRWLDSPGLWNALLGGWSVSAAGYLQSGFPIAVSQRLNNTGLLGDVQRPNGVHGIDPGHPGSTVENLNSYLNPDAWTLAPAFTFGDTPRTDTRVRTPVRHNWDFAFQKSENVGAGRITARVEVINAFDRPDFNGPVTVLGNPNFGRILDVSGFPRLFQFTLRYGW